MIESSMERHVNWRDFARFCEENITGFIDIWDLLPENTINDSSIYLCFYDNANIANQHIFTEDSLRKEKVKKICFELLREEFPGEVGLYVDVCW